MYGEHLREKTARLEGGSINPAPIHLRSAASGFVAGKGFFDDVGDLPKHSGAIRAAYQENAVSSVYGIRSPGGVCLILLMI